MSSGQNQTKGRSPKQYIYPSIDALCACLGVEPSGSDPLRLEDLKSPKTLRMALEREFIKRRPGQYFQDLLAARLGVSDRTIRRYHRDIPILSQPQYLETPVLGFNIDRIPTADTIKRYDLDLGGQFLEDDTGKRWPLKQEIARMLLSRGHHVVHKVKTASYYYFGNALPPPEALYSPRTAAGPPLEGQVRPILAEDKDKRPTPLREKRAAAQREPATRPVKGGGITNKDKTTVQLPLLPGLEPCSIPSKPARKPARPPRKRGKDRHYAKPLADVYLEQLAKDIHHQVDRLSLSNARQLIEMYGPDLVKRTLGKMKWLEREGKLRNPAGFMITAIRVAWKEEGEWGRRQSNFKSILPRKTDSNDDTLLQSEVYRKWRADLGWDGDYLTLSLIEEDLPY